METLVGIVVIVLLVVLFGSLAGYVYLDAPEYGMNPTKWAIITLLVPFFGFVIYVFEREERMEDPPWGDRQDQFVDGPFKIHKSRIDGDESERSRGESDAKNRDS